MGESMRDGVSAAGAPVTGIGEKSRQRSRTTGWSGRTDAVLRVLLEAYRRDGGPRQAAEL